MGENLTIISNDYLSLYIKIIKEKFSKYNLSLNYVKWKGTFLLGSEADKRVFFIQLILKIIIESEFNTFNKKFYINPMLKLYIDNFIPENIQTKISTLVPNFTKLLNLKLSFYEVKAIEAIFYYLFINNKEIPQEENKVIFFLNSIEKDKEFSTIYSTLKNSKILNDFPYLENNLSYISVCVLNLYKEIPYWENSCCQNLIRELEYHFNISFSHKDKLLFLNIFECSIFKKDFEIYNFNDYSSNSNTNVISLVTYFKKLFLKYDFTFLEDDYFKISLFFYYQILQKHFFSINKKIAIIDLSFNNWIGDNLKINLKKNLKLSTIEVINFYSDRLNTDYLSNFDCIFFTHQVDLDTFFRNHPNIQNMQNKCHFIDYSNFFKIEEFLFNVVFLNDLG